MIKQLSLCVFVGLVMVTHVMGQVYSQTTKIEIVSGVDDSKAAMLESKLEVLLKAVNSWSSSGDNVFPDEPGVASLLEIISTLELVASYDSLSTFVMKFGTNVYEIPRIFLQPKQGNKYQFTELIFSFSTEGIFLEARIAPQLQNINRIINRALLVSQEEQKQAEEFLANYRTLLSGKHIEKIRLLFSIDALIVTGSRNQGTNSFEFTRFDTEDYLTRLENYTLVPSNEIDIVFDSVQTYRHPDFNQILGIKVYQHWNTTNYSDEGYMFFIVDFSAEEPLLIARSWQKEPFTTSEFTSIQPNPMNLYLHRSTVDYKNEMGENYAHQLGLSEGLIQFSISETNQNILNANILKNWISENTLYFHNVALALDRMNILNSNLLTVPFSVNWEEGQQSVLSDITIKETSLLKGLSQKVELYLQRKNTINLFASYKDEVNLEQESNTYTGQVAVHSNVSGVDLEIKTIAGQVLKNAFISDSLLQISLVEGEYQFAAEKADYLSSFFEQRINRSDVTEYNLDLKLVEMPIQQIPVVSKKQSYFSKNKYWILGGAAAVVTSSILMMSNGSSSSNTGIPIPPGRPN